MAALYGTIVILVIIIIVLLAKIRLLQKGADETAEALQSCLASDTNTLISLSAGDRHIRRLAAAINRELRILRGQRHKYMSGDRELKEAVTNISHDLRTPLTAISGYLELLEREEQSEDVNRYLTLIANRTEAMKQLTEELFRYSVILSTREGLESEDVCLNDVLEESLAGFYGELIAKGITPEIAITDMKVERQLNRAAVQRVFGNILSNALKYSDGDLSVELNDDGEIVFSNTASALDEVQVGRLFDRFYTVEAARNSHGLGLSIAKVLTEQMGGSVWAEYDRAKFSVHVKF